MTNGGYGPGNYGPGNNNPFGNNNPGNNNPGAGNPFGGMGSTPNQQAPNQQPTFGQPGYGQPGYGQPTPLPPNSAPNGAPGKGPKTALIVGAAALVALLVLGGLAFAFLGGDDADTPPGAAPSSSAPGAAPAPTPTSAAAPSSASGGSSSRPSASSSSRTSSPSGTYGQADGSLDQRYAGALPAGFVGQTRSCRAATVTIKDYSDASKEHTAPGMRCSGVKGGQFENKNIEFTDDRAWAEADIEKAKSMDHQVIKSDGGKSLIVTTYSGGSSNIHYSDTTAGFAVEVYPYDSKSSAEAAAGMFTS